MWNWKVLPRGNPALIKRNSWKSLIDRYDCVTNGANIRDWLNMLIAIFFKTKIPLPIYIYSSAHLRLPNWFCCSIFPFFWHLFYKHQLLFVLKREQVLRNRYTKYILWKSCCVSLHFIIEKSYPHFEFFWQKLAWVFARMANFEFFWHLSFCKNVEKKSL